MQKELIFSLVFFVLMVGFSCSQEDETAPTSTDPTYEAVKNTFGSNIDLNNLANYAGQFKPNYITKDNSGTNLITNSKATLGRVLFYDKKLSTNNTIACASCHQQQFAFSDTALASVGVNGKTGRHSMRLVNARFAQEIKFFWDERAVSLEDQTTRPIQDHAEMGFSGQNGDPSLNDLITKLEAVDYYKELFKFVYGDAEITEPRLQECLSQFIRSIQSFDSKYDIGRAQVNNDGATFPNYSEVENQGKQLFLAPPQFNVNGERIGGGAGCQGCHRAPEFDIDPLSRNNGIIGKIDGGTDLTVTRSPSLRDITKSNGALNGGLMHTAGFDDLRKVIDHYDQIKGNNNNIDRRLLPNGNPQKLQLTQQEKEALIAFLRTLSGTNIYSDVKWSNPFK
jgi:cytochrome c peroxidase